MRKYFFFVSILSILPSIAFGKLLIITYQCSYPDFFELQCKALQAFCEDDYEFVVFDDAKDPAYTKAYKDICEQYGAKYYRVDPKIHTYAYLIREPEESLNHPTVRNCNAVQYSLKKIGYRHDDLLFLLDGDLVPIKSFSMKDLMQDYHIMGINQGKVSNGIKVFYLWIGFVVLDMANLPEKHLINFNCGRINNVPVDAGGYMYHYLEKYKDILHIKKIGAAPIKPYILKHDNLKHLSPFISWNVEYFMGGSFLHYRGGSKWEHKSENYYKQKLKLFKDFILEEINKATYGD